MLQETATDRARESREKALALAYSELMREFTTALYLGPDTPIDAPAYGERLPCSVAAVLCIGSEDDSGLMAEALRLVMACAEDDDNPQNAAARGFVSVLSHAFADEHASARVRNQEGLFDDQA